jgi:hypothetical protein
VNANWSCLNWRFLDVRETLNHSKCQYAYLINLHIGVVKTYLMMDFLESMTPPSYQSVIIPQRLYAAPRGLSGAMSTMVITAPSILFSMVR